ncbi:MAG: hypothetical protein WCJ01_08370 [Ignavibacteria bacterium]
MENEIDMGELMSMLANEGETSYTDEFVDLALKLNPADILTHAVILDEALGFILDEVLTAEYFTEPNSRRQYINRFYSTFYGAVYIIGGRELLAKNANLLSVSVEQIKQIEAGADIPKGARGLNAPANEAAVRYVNDRVREALWIIEASDEKRKEVMEKMNSRELLAMHGGKFISGKVSSEKEKLYIGIQKILKERQRDGERENVKGAVGIYFKRNKSEYNNYKSDRTGKVNEASIAKTFRSYRPKLLNKYPELRF